MRCHDYMMVFFRLAYQLVVCGCCVAVRCLIFGKTKHPSVARVFRFVVKRRKQTIRPERFGNSSPRVSETPRWCSVPKNWRRIPSSLALRPLLQGVLGMPGAHGWLGHRLHPPGVLRRARWK